MLLLLRLPSTRGHHHHFQADQDVRPEVDARQPVLRHVQQGGQWGRQYVVRVVTGESLVAEAEQLRSCTGVHWNRLQVQTRLLTPSAGQFLR